MFGLGARDCGLAVTVAVAMPIPVTVAQLVASTMTSAVVMMSSGFFQLSSRRLAQRVGEVEARRHPAKPFNAELTIGVFAIALTGCRDQGVLLRMLGQRILLADGDRPVTFGVSTRGITFDDASLGAVQQAVAVGALEPDANPLGQQEGQHGSHE